jgi:hypothetical protein
MKIVVPPITQEGMEGEKEPERVQGEYPVSLIAHGNSKTDHVATAGIVKRLYAQGLFTRAIVAGGGPAVLNSLEAQCDPKNWGIVVAVEPYRPYPLIIRWADGQQGQCTESEVILIWPGFGKDECKEHLRGIKNNYEGKKT